jgi:hypothetical protein
MVAVMAAAPLLESEGDDTTVAAVQLGAGSGQPGRGGRQRGGSWRGKKKPGRGGGSGQQVSHTVSQAEQAMLESGLCVSHFCFGTRAKQCRAPCTWPGN